MSIIRSRSNHLQSQKHQRQKHFLITHHVYKLQFYLKNTFPSPLSNEFFLQKSTHTHTHYHSRIISVDVVTSISCIELTDKTRVWHFESQCLQCYTNFFVHNGRMNLPFCLPANPRDRCTRSPSSLLIISLLSVVTQDRYAHNLCNT